MAKELIQHINGTIIFSSDSRGNVLVCTSLTSCTTWGCDIIESVLVIFWNTKIIHNASKQELFLPFYKIFHTKI
jgi:hypothetical protein